MTALADQTDLCPKPRRATTASGAIFLSFGLAIVASGCSIVIPEPPDPGCPNLSELCPDLVCPTGHQTNDEGCLICQCNDDEPAPTVCWDDGDCTGGQRCDNVNFCESPPGCADGQPCPDVCYGRCVDAPQGCESDADCGEGEACRFGEPVNAPEAQPNDDGLRAPCQEGDENCDPAQRPLTGICVPVECADDRLAYPACPPGTEPVLDYTQDPCGQIICLAVDDCRDLSPELCEQIEGCHLEYVNTGGGGCDCGPNEDCLCAPEQEEPTAICVPDDTSCYGLDEESCAANPDCRIEYYIADCAAPPDGCEEDPDCLWQCDPAYGFACLPRDDDQTCFSDFDCAPGERCSYESECYDVCYGDESGEVFCYTECYGNTGICIPADTTCYDLPVELCEQDPRCMLESYGAEPCVCDPSTGDCACNGDEGLVCVPRPSVTCYSDADCGYGQVCELNAYCPPCADGDWTCDMPCHVEGVCVDVGPSVCEDNAQCPPGSKCEVVIVCEACAYPGDDNGQQDPIMPPEECIGTCWEEVLCVPVEPTDICYSNDDCAEGTQCNLDVCLPDPNCPECDVCVGVCEQIPGDLCFIDDDCGAGAICNTWDYCEFPGDAPPNGLIACLGRCEMLPPPPSACLDDQDCGEGERCATELDICYCPDGVCTMEAPCYSMCVPADPIDVQCFIDEDCGPDAKCENGVCVFDGVDCVQVITYAIDANGQCHEFPTPCDVPADMQVVESCQN